MAFASPSRPTQHSIAAADSSTGAKSDILFTNSAAVPKYLGTVFNGVRLRIQMSDEGDDAGLEDREAVMAQLESLKSEHRDLDDVIARIADTVPFDQLQLQRLKKRKLILKDEITKLEDKLIPDIIA
jgi:hypothetical protein